MMIFFSFFKALKTNTRPTSPTQEANVHVELFQGPKVRIQSLKIIEKNMCFEIRSNEHLFDFHGLEAQAHPWSSGRLWASNKYQDHSRTYSVEFPRFAGV